MFQLSIEWSDTDFAGISPYDEIEVDISWEALWIMKSLKQWSSHAGLYNSNTIIIYTGVKVYKQTVHLQIKYISLYKYIGMSRAWRSKEFPRFTLKFQYSPCYFML